MVAMISSSSSRRYGSTGRACAMSWVFTTSLNSRLVSMSLSSDDERVGRTRSLASFEDHQRIDVELDDAIPMIQAERRHAQDDVDYGIEVGRGPAAQPFEDLEAA